MVKSFQSNSLSDGLFQLVGVLNVTPDSFSDGGDFLDPKAALQQGEALFAQGANIIDIGGDSTRPGSVCVGEELEWQRIQNVVTELSKIGLVSVDTHFLSTARKAIHAGAKYINDVSGGSKEMFELCADSNSTLISMFSSSKMPHVFLENNSFNIIDEIKVFFDKSLEKAQTAGLPISLEILFNLKKLFNNVSLMIGVSRKGFLKKYTVENSNQEKDALSALIGVRISEFFKDADSAASLYLRVHNPSIHKVFSNFWSDWRKNT